jgi:hypothetical protein
MKQFFLTTLLLLTHMAVLAQKYPDDGMYRYQLGFSVGQTNFVDTIPILFEGDQVYVPVTIKGRQHLFNLDTGSSQGVVYYGSDIDYSMPIGKVNSRDANGKIDTIPAVKFPTFKMGRLTVSGYVGSLHRRPPGRYRYDGIIGFDLFNKGLQAKIDTRAKVLILSDIKNFFDKEEGYEVSYKLHRFVPYLRINTFLKYEEETLFDTGSQDFFVMNKAHFDKERYKDPRVVSLIENIEQGQAAIANYGAEKGGQVIYMNFPTLPWGKAFTFKDIRSYTTQGDSRLGGMVLQYGALVINPKRKRMKLQPYDGKEFAIVNNTLDDISYIPVDGKAVVGLVRRSSQAYKNGFRRGDIIVSINNTAINSFDDFKDYPFVKGRTYVFVLESARGFKKEIKIERWGEKEDRAPSAP